MDKEVNLLSKMNIKAICGLGRGDDAKEFMRKQAETNAELAAIAGEVTGYGGKVTQYNREGEKNFFLLGSFMAINRQTGEVFRSGKLYLPAGITETIKSQFDSRKEATETVNFQLTVTVIKDKEAATGYVYLVEPIRSPEAVNKERLMLDSLLALPAPKEKVKQIGATASKK